MKKAFVLALTIILGISSTASAVEMPPATDVSCGISSGELVCSNSIVISGSWTISGENSTNWFIWKLKTGTDPAIVSNYENQTLYKNYPYTSGTTSFTYEYLLNFVGNDPNGVVLVGAALVSVSGGNTLSNESGRKTYIKLADLKASIDKAKADAEAKANTNSNLNLESLLKSEIGNVEMRLSSLQKIMFKFAEPKVNFPKYQGLFRNKLFLLDKAIKSNSITFEQFNTQIAQIKQDIEKLISDIDRKHTLICTKGGSVISVKAVKPKCPNGYKSKRP